MPSICSHLLFSINLEEGGDEMGLLASSEGAVKKFGKAALSVTHEWGMAWASYFLLRVFANIHSMFE